MLTQTDILKASEHIEKVYEKTVDDLLENLAKHFKITGWERTRFWEAKKLSELGKLTRESAEIIARDTKYLPEEIEDIFLTIAEKACKDLDTQLAPLAKAGKLTDPAYTARMSPFIRQAIGSYVDQAIDKCNLTNATMLASTRESFSSAVVQIASAELQAESRMILDTKSMEVVTHQETRTRAIRQAMEQMAEKGITGFVDSRGRNWSPEAYSAMVIRTSSHNAAIQSIRARQMEYGGGDIFQVSSHPGARPLCYPYQGRFFSWSSGPGTFTDGAGEIHEYQNISDSSYGEPAGLFGINCGHHPIPVIPGLTFPQDGPEQNYEENRKEYEESQIQRQYERDIRQAKRELSMAEATGDVAEQKRLAKEVRRQQAEMRSFIEQTGRPRRYDREQVGRVLQRR